MMKSAGVISVGNELLSGQTVDTNTAYLGMALQAVNVQMARHWTVPDELDAIAEALTHATQTCDVILVTGGLGPTDDDLTRHALADFLGVDLIKNQVIIDYLTEFFQTRGYPMPKRNEVQALIPAGCHAIENRWGTAPGIKGAYQGIPIYVMPGVPSEMEGMFEHTIKPELEAVSTNKIVTRKLKCFGAGESSLVDMLGDRMQRARNPLVNCTVDFGVITLHVVGASEKRSEAEALVEKEVAELREILGDLVFGEENDTIASVIGRYLNQTERTLAVAESCTGGLISKLVTDVPGSSVYFKQGWVTYSNESKVNELGVSKKILKDFGAVSESVAREMAIGAIEKSGSDYAVSVTGIAGPGGGTESKPVGLVFIGIATKESCDVKKYVFTRNRASVRLRAAQAALHQLWQKL